MVVAWCSRAFAALIYAPRKRLILYGALLLIGLLSIILVFASLPKLPQEDRMQREISDIHAHLRYMESLYRGKEQDVMGIQTKLRNGGLNTQHALTNEPTTTMRPEVTALLKNISGSHAAQGIQPSSLQIVQFPFVYQLLPHLMEDPYTLRPSYHMHRYRNTMVDVVIGVPTVKRDKDTYLFETLEHLLKGMTDGDKNSSLIVVFVGETDLEYVLNTAYHIETKFPQAVQTGLIEVLSPSSSYYPDLDNLTPNLGDSLKRFKWRTKQNLDAIYLMAYAHSKGAYYLMLEDDVIAKSKYLLDIKDYVAEITASHPNWFFIEFCPVGGIGKLFRSADLMHFITYLQLFYTNMPIDWLLESYLADRVCTIEKASKACGEAKLTIRPKYTTSLFMHIGLYSSLKGKIQKMKVNGKEMSKFPPYYPHNNPPLSQVYNDIEENPQHTFLMAYTGKTYFWGKKPKKGDAIEFWFDEPTPVFRYTFRTGNLEHLTDKFYDTVIEIKTVDGNFTMVDEFDEFGMADGEIKAEIGPLAAMRFRVTRDSSYWVLLSEIDIRIQGQDLTR